MSSKGMTRWALFVVVAVMQQVSAARAGPVNIALNPLRTGLPSPLGSDRGWGGGSDPWEIVDGLQTYNEWYHGLAFTGGHTGGWGSGGYLEPAGPRQVTIDFGTSKSFDEVVVWHHGPDNNHTPADTSLSYWNGTDWAPISFTRTVGAHILGGAGSISDEYVFSSVTGSKVRYSFDNSGANILGTPNIHGWIYEFEVFQTAVPEPSTLASSLIGALLVGGITWSKARRRGPSPA